MAVFTTDSIREKAAEEYASLDIKLKDGTTTVLLNALRLPKRKRKALMSIQDSLDGEEERDEEEFFADAIKLIAETEDQALALLDEFDGDLASLAMIFKLYSSKTELGEASASQD